MPLLAASFAAPIYEDPSPHSNLLQTKAVRFPASAHPSHRQCRISGWIRLSRIHL